jgi:hypothetical protein
MLGRRQDMGSLSARQGAAAPMMQVVVLAALMLVASPALAQSALSEGRRYDAA